MFFHSSAYLVGVKRCGSNYSVLFAPGSGGVNRQKGTAIVVALFVTALVAAAAVAMIEQSRIHMRQTELILNDRQAELFLQGSVDWAAHQLIINWQQRQPQQVIDRTPIQSSVNEVSGAKISSIILDAQGFFNLNNLRDALYQPIFFRLLQAVDPETDADNIKKIISATADWINLLPMTRLLINCMQSVNHLIALPIWRCTVLVNLD